MSTPKYSFCQLDEVPAVTCPCGQTKRAFIDDPEKIASFHFVDIKGGSEEHYHKILTEIYYIVEGEGTIILDGDEFPVKPQSTILIKPGCRHQLVGDFKMINVPIPAFDPDDEWFD